MLTRPLLPVVCKLQGMKALRKLFTRRGSHAGQHIRLDEEERLQNSFTR